MCARVRNACKAVESAARGSGNASPSLPKSAPDHQRQITEDPKNPGQTPPAAIVLLSDGASNLGRSSVTAATDAKKKGVPVYTIAYGTAGGYVVDSRGQKQSVPVDHAELQKVADNSGGKKFSAASAGELKQVYDSIAHQIGYERVEAEITEKYAGIATIFGILTAMAAVSLGARWP